MTKKNLLAKKVLALLLALCLSSCTGTIQLSLYTSDGLPAMARIATPDNGESVIALPGSISISKNSKKPLHVYVQEDSITEPSSQEIESIGAMVNKSCETTPAVWFLPFLWPVLPVWTPICRISAKNVILKDGSAYAPNANIRIDVQRKTQPKGDKPSVYSTPGSITDVKYE